jgi:hypothetical protein
MKRWIPVMQPFINSLVHVTDLCTVNRGLRRFALEHPVLILAHSRSESADAELPIPYLARLEWR